MANFENFSRAYTKMYAESQKYKSEPFKVYYIYRKQEKGRVLALL